MIRRVTVQNFKSLRDVTVELNEVTVLIGRSGSGKSNFLEAVRCLRDLLKKGPGSAMQMWPRLVSATASQAENVVFEFEFDFPGLSDVFIYYLSMSVGDVHSVTEERLSLGSRVLFHQRQKNWAKPPEIVNPPRPGQIALPTIAGLQEAAIAREILSNGVACYDFPGTVLQTSGGSAAPPFADNGENFIASLAAIENDIKHLHHWKQIVAALQRLDESTRTLAVPRPTPDRIDVVHQLGEKLLNLNLSQESEGFRRFLAHFIALYQVPERTLIAFDEPEKGIYPGALAILAEEFKEAPAAGRGQILLTTHSPQLLDQFEPEFVRVVEMRGNSTTIGPLASDQFESVRERLMSAGELLTVDPARITTPAA